MLSLLQLERRRAWEEKHYLRPKHTYPRKYQKYLSAAYTIITHTTCVMWLGIISVWINQISIVINNPTLILLVAAMYAHWVCSLAHAK